MSNGRVPGSYRLSHPDQSNSRCPFRWSFISEFCLPIPQTALNYWPQQFVFKYHTTVRSYASINTTQKLFSTPLES